MIKSLLHFNNPNDLTKDEVNGVPWKVNGTMSSSQNGKFGNCLSMTGNGYLQNNTIDLSLDKEWTLDMWFYAANFSGNNSQSLFSICSSNSPRVGIFSENDTLIFGLLNNTWEYHTLHLPVDRWAHFALVHDTSTFYAFVDGVERVKRTNQAIAPFTNQEILIGLDRTISNSFKGLVDEFRISDEALWTFDFTPPTYEAPTSKYIFIDKNNTVMGMKE